MIGFINVNKPAGLTSAQVVASVKRQLNLPRNVKIGHMGTLDKQASGVLPIAVGRATRLFDFMLTKKKYYRAEFTFGFATDSLDSAGEIVERVDGEISSAQVNAVLSEFLGDIMQVPPVFSAKNVGGKRASDLARSGQIVSLNPSQVHIFEFQQVDHPRQNTFVFDIVCSAGTYIRSLCRDLANRLNTVGTMTALVRTRAGVFALDNAVELDSVDDSVLLPPEIVLGGLERLDFDTQNELQTLLNGQKLILQKDRGLYAFWCEGKLRGLVEIDEAGAAKMKVWL